MLTTADTMIKNVTFQGYIISSNAVKKRSIPLYSIVHSYIIERKKVYWNALNIIITTPNPLRNQAKK